MSPQTDHLERFEGLREILLDLPEGICRLQVGEVRRAGKAMVIRLADEKSSAFYASLKGKGIVVSPDDRYCLPADEYYVSDLVGLEVRDSGGQFLGHIEEVLRTGANDVYQIVAKEGSEILLPAVKGVIKKIDVEGGYCVVDAEGFIELG